MPASAKKKQYDIEYAKTHLKRVPLDLRLDKYIEIKAHAENNAETVNGFIKRAIDETMERDATGKNDEYREAKVNTGNESTRYNLLVNVYESPVCDSGKRICPATGRRIGFRQLTSTPFIPGIAFTLWSACRSAVLQSPMS